MQKEKFQSLLEASSYRMIAIRQKAATRNLHEKGGIVAGVQILEYLLRLIDSLIDPNTP